MTTRIRTTRGRAGAPALVLALGLLTLGCNKDKEAATGGENQFGPGNNPMGGPPMPGGGPPPQEVLAKLPGGEEHAAGKRVYANNNCANCHKLGEAGGSRGGGPGRGGPGGPDLTSVGKKADRTKQWLADHIRDPKSHRPQSRMPPFGPDKISDADLNLLAEYLASRK
jgi:mono/diheme cytochrome c family protein